ncbi:tetratricopeptide repeat protein [Schleiferia thermophila]|uniref:Tetratricopeptide repeat protein n=1 Tax=Schleiferia thermophila TaxID=884107 RepID=A0A369A9K1_9FLAO|nr:tetratricopeptide repeat protein [Schleiferia thermophila]RCX04986.1 tetratricopeptide repeat protein [Schleiferia thermophila]GCD79496.1 hypothetical protein JCM30197_07430 [Schleiferia thermophila]
MRTATALMFFLCTFFAEAQISGYKRSVNEGNRLFNEEKYEESYKKFQQAIAKRNGINTEAAEYNAGNAKYKLNDYQEAENTYKKIIRSTSNKSLKAKAYHNLGNTHYQNKDYRNAVEAYKQALILDPSDDETRYNLARALTMLQNQKSSEGGMANDKKNNNQRQNDSKSGQLSENETQENEKSKIDETIAENLMQYLNQKDNEVQSKVREKEHKKKRTRKNEKDW